MEGTGEIWACDLMATYWKKVKVVITRDGSWTLISPCDQKKLLLLPPDYPCFLGTGKYRRLNVRAFPKRGQNTDLGISGSDTKDSDREDEDTVHIMGSEENEGGFSKPLPSDGVEVRYDGESIEIKLGLYISDSNAV